jgi:tetratricopeptide (TPR) repeat protein
MLSRVKQWQSDESGGISHDVGRYLRLIDNDKAKAPKDKLSARFEKLARNLFKAGRYDGAIAAANRAIEHEPEFGRAHGVRGAALLEVGCCDEALAACNRAIELDFGQAHGVRGAALWVVGRCDEALAAADRAIELEPKLSWAHGVRGAALWELGRCDEALAAFDRAIELEPKLSWAHGVRGMALAKLAWAKEKKKKLEDRDGFIEKLDKNKKAEYHPQMPNTAEDDLTELLDLVRDTPVERRPSLKEILVNFRAAEAITARGEAPAETATVHLEHAAKETTTPKPSDGPAWPTEKWKGSPEELSRKIFAIVAFLRRVWKPFIEETGALVTRKVLADRDPKAALALKGFLRAHDMPRDIRILSDQKLKEYILSERPVLLPATSPDNNIPAPQ